MPSRGVNKKLLRMVGGNTRLIDAHQNNIWELAERRVLKEQGATYRRPPQLHAETLAGHRCIAFFRRGR